MPGGPAGLPHPVAGRLRAGELGRLPSLHWGQRDYQWELFGPDGARLTIPHRPRMVTDDLLALRNGVLGGSASPTCHG